MINATLLVRCVLGACLLAAALPAASQAQRQSSGGNAQLVQQMQQLAAERTALQADNAKMKRELEELRKERDAFKSTKESNDRRARASEAALARAAQERESGEDELARTKEQAQQLVVKFRETIEELRTAESDRTQLRQTLVTRETELKTCVVNNGTLYQLNDEILTRMEGQGFWTAVGRAEPFTRLKRVQLENLADEYRGRAQDANVAAPPDAKPPG